MKFKLDENIGRRGVELLRAAGHDVMTILDQNMQGASDRDRFAACAIERRALITLDRDFGQVLRFRPEDGAGVVVLDLGARATSAALTLRLREFIAAARGVDSLVGELWIVEPGRVRVHLREDKDPPPL